MWSTSVDTEALAKNVCKLFCEGKSRYKHIFLFCFKVLSKLASFSTQHLVICDLRDNQEFRTNLARQFQETQITYIPIDVTKRPTIEKAFQLAADTLKRLDVVVNGCGLMNDRFIDLTMAINLVRSHFTVFPCYNSLKNDWERTQVEGCKNTAKIKDKADGRISQDRFHMFQNEFRFCDETYFDWA